MSGSDSRRQRRTAAKTAPAAAPGAAPAPPTTPIEMAPAPQGPAPASAPAFVDPKVDCMLIHDVVSHTLRGGINYLYLGRVDADPMGSQVTSLKIVLQVAIPTEGLLNSFFMLESVIRKMHAEGIVTKEMIQQGRSRYAPVGNGGL